MTESSFERGEFFAVDARAWSAVADLGSMNAMVAYLVLARGTHGLQRTTTWSANAIERFTSVHWRLGVAAIAKLIEAGFVEQLAGFQKRQRPIYRLKTPREIFGAADLEPAWVFLPNAIVDGISDEPTAIELVRQSADKLAMRLFVELYAAQRLPDVGGVHWTKIRRTFARTAIREKGHLIVYGFSEGDLSAPDRGFEDNYGRDEFWRAIQTLSFVGLIEFVGHLIDADDLEGVVLHPFPIGHSGEASERLISRAAQAAGLAMLNPIERRQAFDRGLHIVPVQRHLRDIALVGLLRLRFRARTAATAMWLANEPSWARYAAEYAALGGTGERASRTGTTRYRSGTE